MRPCGSPPAVCRAPLERAFSMCVSNPWNCYLLIIGPMAVSALLGLPILSVRTRAEKRSTNWS